MKRQSGILLPIYSLPSEYGCGSLGREAYNFIDFLSAAGQSVWQVLPVGPVNDSHSPYQSISSFAGNPYLIDIDMLADDGLISEDEAAEERHRYVQAAEEKHRYVQAAQVGRDEGSNSVGINKPAEEIKPFGGSNQHKKEKGCCYVQYEKLKKSRKALLWKAFCRVEGLTGNPEQNDEFSKYKEEKKDWLYDYALYAAARDFFGCGWTDWPDEGLRLHNQPAVKTWSEKLSKEIEFYCFMQFLFAMQWQRLKAYARDKGVLIIGDIPVYVPMDSADIWAERQFFQLEGCRPKAVSGVPPDYFNEEGQLWNNPLYDWNVLKADGYGFWIRRIGRTLEYFDVVRIDHFRGFDSYWSVPFGAEYAKEGHWEKGPGFDFVNVITSWFGGEHFIAEDLGDLSDSVRQLLKDSGLPGMTVLEFAFDGPQNAYLPHNHKKNSVCYIGTHDNNTLAGWAEERSRQIKADECPGLNENVCCEEKRTNAPNELEFAAEYLGINSGVSKLTDAFIRAGMGSVADTFIMQMQDVLGLGSEARTNTPGTPSGNWEWKLAGGELTDELAEYLRKLSFIFGRSNSDRT